MALVGKLETKCADTYLTLAVLASLRCMSRYFIVCNTIYQGNEKLGLSKLYCPLFSSPKRLARSRERVRWLRERNPRRSRGPSGSAELQRYTVILICTFRVYVCICCLALSCNFDPAFVATCCDVLHLTCYKELFWPGNWTNASNSPNRGPML